MNEWVADGSVAAVGRSIELYPYHCCPCRDIVQCACRDRIVHDGHDNCLSVHAKLPLSEAWKRLGRLVERHGRAQRAWQA